MCASSFRCKRGFVDGIATFQYACIFMLSRHPFQKKSNKVIMREYVFVCVGLPWFLGLQDSAIVIITHLKGTGHAMNHNKSLQNLLIQTSSFLAHEATIYSAHVVESAIVSRLELFQLANESHLYRFVNFYQCNLYIELMLIVTAPDQHPKIWAKFSLFDWHCIMAFTFNLLFLNKATLGN